MHDTAKVPATIRTSDVTCKTCKTLLRERAAIQKAMTETYSGQIRVAGATGKYETPFLIFSVDVNYAKLLGPNGGHYLPCETCHNVHEVALNVVSVVCEICAAERDADHMGPDGE